MPLESAQFEGTAAIRDKQKNKTHYVNLEIAAIYPEQLRVNATATLGIYVGSFATNETEATLLSALEKKFYKGANSPEIFSKLTKLNILPQDFIRLLLNHPLETSRWKCKDSAKAKICELKDSEMKVRESHTSSGERTIEFSSPQADMKMAIEQTTTKVENDPKQFKIEPPSQFKVYQLN